MEMRAAADLVSNSAEHEMLLTESRKKAIKNIWIFLICLTIVSIEA